MIVYLPGSFGAESQHVEIWSNGHVNHNMKIRSMTMEEITIHEIDFALINEFFTELERQGPGSAEETVRALSFIGNISNKTKIADLGCGTGFQTMVLAQNTEATITALDLFAGSIDKLNAKAERHGLQDRVKGIVGSMDDLQFGDE